MRLLPASGLAAAAMLTFLAAPAAASGGIGCEARDAAVVLDIGIGVSRGGGGFFNVSGALDIASADLPADLAALQLGDKLIHSWLDGDELKLQFYHERSEGDFATITLVVEAEATEEGTYGGTYSVAVFGIAPAPGSTVDTWSISGPVLCYVE